MLETSVGGSERDRVKSYLENGYALPIEVLKKEEAFRLRSDLEVAEEELASDPEKLDLLCKYPDRLLPVFDDLVRHKALLDSAASILGDDLLVWSSGFFVKEPQTDKIVSWHQDLTYWGLDDAEEVTLWLALSPANRLSGCMKFIPGSHRQKIMPHKDTFSESNLLSRGQEIAVDVNEDEAIFAELAPGQASMHHGRLFHASGPNKSQDRRIGFAIRYIKPSMRQSSGKRPLATLVRGSDDYGHFELSSPPKGRLHDRDFEVCRRDKASRDTFLYN